MVLYFLETRLTTRGCPSFGWMHMTSGGFGQTDYGVIFVGLKKRPTLKCPKNKDNKKIYGFIQMFGSKKESSLS